MLRMFRWESYRHRMQTLGILFMLLGLPLTVVGLVFYLGPRGAEMLLRPGQRWVRVPVALLTPELQRHFRGLGYVSADANRLVETPRGLTVML